jgi:hypothetical protein
VIQETFSNAFIPVPFASWASFYPCKFPLTYVSVRALTIFYQNFYLLYTQDGTSVFVSSAPNTGTYPERVFKRMG